MKKHIFTIIAGCAPVGIEMLKSYFKFHKEKIHVYLFSSDWINMPVKSIGGNFQEFIVVHILPDSLKESFARGHEGTAKVWARVMRANPDSYLIQIDSDVIFKKNALNLIKDAGYPDIYGSRRCYKNNPGKAPVHEGAEDAISTYFVGFRSSFLGSFLNDGVLTMNLERMIQGVCNPLGFPVLDFFDPVFFYARSQGAQVFYEDNNLIGGQNNNGSKHSAFKSNMHLDMGVYLAHFGGVGSGYANHKIISAGGNPGGEKSYINWSINRWDLFADLFINPGYPFTFCHAAKYDDTGRWIDGPCDREIWDQINKDLKS